MKTATLQDALNARPCYKEEQVKALFGSRETLDVNQLAALDIPDADKVWALAHPHFLDTKENAVRFAVFCAEQSLPIFETRFPEDKRPRAAIEAAKAWLQNPTAAAAADSAEAASASAYAARAIAQAAYAPAQAAYAPAEAASAAAYDADYAAEAAGNAAAYAACDADYAAAARRAQVKFLVELLTAAE